MLVLVLLVARLPPVERAVGQDQLVAWHRRLGPWPLYLVASHGVLIVLGYAQQARTGPLGELWTLLSTYPGVLAGSVGFVLLVAAGVSSYRAARRRLAYETWWAVHLYTYIALGLAFSHQVATGAPFVGHPLARLWWTVLWLGAAALVIGFRVLAPLVRSLRHRLVVAAVEPAGAGAVSIVLRGRALDRLPVSGGQFLQWRFLAPGLWWQAHPYSVSALPRPPFLRLTVKTVGDHGAALAALAPGTRVAVEGPYGRFTRHARGEGGVLLAGAGVGTAPLHALLEDLPDDVDVELILRASTGDGIVLRDALVALAAARGGRVHELVGPRADVRVDAAALERLVPDIATRDVYVCGPEGFAVAVADGAAAAGVPLDRIHREVFAF
jgi:ferredoxin-NADP reductase/DMSO/TMAO reductase YedYZ heme-binding membrane subunit